MGSGSSDFAHFLDMGEAELEDTLAQTFDQCAPPGSRRRRAAGGPPYLL